MKRREEVHILEYGAILFVFLVALYVSSLNVTGLFVASEYAYSREVSYTSVEKKVSENVKFGNYSPSSCSDGIYVEAAGVPVNFTLKNEKYKSGLCTKATVVFDNIIYSKADKKKNATSITYLIYYGRRDGVPSNDTDDEQENAPPQFLKDIPDMTIEFNGSYSINLSEYFSDNETLAFTSDSNANISIIFQDYTVAFAPLSYPYNGTHQINATDGEYTASSNIFGVYAKPPPLMNATESNQSTNQTFDDELNQAQQFNVTLIYPKNNSVMFVGNHIFVFSSSNGTCSVIVRNQTAQDEAYLEKGYYWWGVSCNYMNKTYPSGKNYFVVMPQLTLSMNYSDIADLSNATNVTLEKPSVGRLVFDEPIDLTAVQEMEKYINISRNRVEIDTASMQYLNKSAVLTLYGVAAANPVIKQNGLPCPADVCQIISYEGGTLVFRVKHFTVYEVGDAPQPEPVPQTSSGGGSSGGSGNFVQSPESSFGGPVIITKKTPVENATASKISQAEEIKPEAQTIPQTDDTESGAPYSPPEENKNIITGGIIRIFAENFMYIAVLLGAAGAGYIFLKGGKKKGKRRRRK
ncbi:MAG: hypothetical protein HYW27_04475 [Candidatus Aenigmarchaeota archaeon]|nr:hypothetical protein [Candidatus Aenigmarchaeota archaeon]